MGDMPRKRAYTWHQFYYRVEVQLVKIALAKNGHPHGRDGPGSVGWWLGLATICTWTNKRMNGGWELFCRINYSKQANDRK